ncbi:MAG: hypothetical protein EP330_10100 [Deltaproteobacteria bacterium]|nr:MAG: hypothetical protein EP330_10100 [Deltaproteobacteria bacterium]
MRPIFLLLFASGCVTPAGIDDDPPGRNGLGLFFELSPSEEVEDTAEEMMPELESFELVVDEVRFVGDLNDAPTETTDGTNVAVELLGGGGLAGLPTLSLIEGTYTDATYEVRLSSLRLEAIWMDEEVTVEVDSPVSWTAETSRFVLPDGPDPAVRFALDPMAWLEDLSLEEAMPTTKGDYLLSASSNPDLYADVLGAIVDRTQGEFPEGLE